MRKLFLLLILSVALCNATAQPQADSTYRIETADAALCLSTGGKTDLNAPVEACQPVESPATTWQLVKGNTGFLVTNVESGLALDIPASRKPLQWSPGKSNPNQNYTFEPVGKGLYKMYASNQASDARAYIVLTKSGVSVVADKEQATALRLCPVHYEKPYYKWQDQTVFAENRLTPRAAHTPYPDTHSLHADATHYEKPWTPSHSPLRLDLGGVWKLKWSTLPCDIPGESDFYGDQVDTRGWDTLSVPSCLEMKGYGEPLYVNEEYGFVDNPPYIRMHPGLKNSVASYRRDFQLPTSFDGKRVLLHFDGIYGAASIWVNGEYVGYSQGANNEAAFDVTPYVKQNKRNNISVQLIRWNDGSYLEGQDMWHLSGLHRDVYLTAVPKVGVKDFILTSKLDSINYTRGVFTAMVQIENMASPRPVPTQLNVRLISPEGNLVEEMSQDVMVQADKEAIVTLNSGTLNDIALWSAEHPNLYTVEIVLSHEGKETEAIAQKFGFRDVRISNGLVLVNGKRVYFKGVNTQDTHPYKGRTMDEATMLRDVTLMKQAGVNTVRCSHYPRQHKMYSLFDYYGIYCMDEADLECHKNWSDGGSMSSDTTWLPAYLERERAMVMQHRNFSSILFWSLGNESNGGKNFDACYNLVRHLDPVRPIHYEGATRARQYGASDLFSQMYPSVQRTIDNARANDARQPYFICEYAHAMGNGVGNLQEYWDAIIGSRYGIGGCIWDWVDQSILDGKDIRRGNIEQNGLPRLMTGNDYGGPNQANFVNNGILTATREWSPKLTEVKQVFQPIRFLKWDAATRTVTVRNDAAFTSTGVYRLKYSLLCDGRVVESRVIPTPNLAPTETGQFTLPLKKKIKQGREYTVQIDFLLKEDTQWAAAGYSVAGADFILQERPEVLPKVRARKPVAVSMNDMENGGALNVKAADVVLAKDAEGKVLCSLFASPVEFDGYAYVENFKGQYPETNPVQSRKLGQLTTNADGSASVTEEVQTSQCDYTLLYTIYGDGTLDIQATFRPKREGLRRIGLTMRLPESLQHVSYYGRGPLENYPDRKYGSRLGRYETTVSDNFWPYAHPQSCGNHMDVRSAAFTRTDGTGLCLQTQGDVAMQVLPYTDLTMAHTRHPWDLKPEGVVLHLDAAIQGVGNGSCGGGNNTLPQYQCPKDGTLTYTLRFSPLK